MTAHEEKSYFIKFASEVNIREYEVTDFNRVSSLSVESHCGRLIGECRVFRIPIAVHTHLNCQRSESMEVKIHVAVKAERREWQDIIV